MQLSAQAWQAPFTGVYPTSQVVQKSALFEHFKQLESVHVAQVPWINPVPPKHDKHKFLSEASQVKHTFEHLFILLLLPDPKKKNPFITWLQVIVFPEKEHDKQPGGQNIALKLKKHNPPIKSGS